MTEAEILEIFEKLKGRKLCTDRDIFTIENIEYSCNNTIHVWCILGTAGFRNSAIFSVDEIKTLLEEGKVEVETYDAQYNKRIKILYSISKEE